MIGVRHPRYGLVTLALLAAVVAVPTPVHAALDPRLTARLDPTTAAAVGEIVDAAHERGLPTEPLVARALEGASRRVPGPRIVESVRNLSAGLLESRERLGPGSTSAELVAGAAALAAGVPADTLSALRVVRGRESAVVPLVVIVDLVTREVPVETASAAVLAATRARAPDLD